MSWIMRSKEIKDVKFYMLKWKWKQCLMQERDFETIEETAEDFDSNVEERLISLPSYTFSGGGSFCYHETHEFFMSRYKGKEI